MEGLEASTGREVALAADEPGLTKELLWLMAGIAVDVANRKTQVGRRRIITPRVKSLRFASLRRGKPSTVELLIAVMLLLRQ
jgi:hypothetical protein